MKPEPVDEIGGPGATYGTVAALRDPAVEAGFGCPRWQQGNR